MQTGVMIETLQNAFWQQGEVLMMHHTNPWELDEALVAWGYGVGPCEAQDLIGLHHVLARQPVRSIPILPRMVAEGRMGKIGGVGYYRYPGGGGAVIDPLIEDLVLEEAWFAKVTRSELPPTELTSRMHASLITQLQAFLAQGVSQDAVQSALEQGLHFPKGRVFDF